MLREKLEELVAEATSGNYADEIYNARKEYQKNAGEIYEDDKSYEARMALFLEWYVFDRLVPGNNHTPLEIILEEKRRLSNPDLIEIHEGFASSTHGLFLVKKIRENSVLVQNLFNGERYQVSENEGRFIFQKNDLFEGRVIPYRGEYFFSGNYCFHPREAAKYIKDEARKISNIIEGFQKQMKIHVKQLDSIRGQKDKMISKTEKIKAKIEKARTEKKQQALKHTLEELESSIISMEQQIADIEKKKKQFEVDNLKIESRRICAELTQRLSYMNLKWERSRQIDLHDIYRN